MTSADRPAPIPQRSHLPSLATGLAIMIGGTVYPLAFADAAGGADHALTIWLLWAMSAGFVRGVGFVPRNTVWRWLLSGWACAGMLALAALTWLAR